MAPVPKYKQVARQLQNDIVRSFPDGSRIPTEAKLEKRYGVSRITVRQAVSELINLGMLSRQQGRGTYVVDAGAASRNQQPMNIIFSTPNIAPGRTADPFFGDILRGISAEAGGKHLNISFNDYNFDKDSFLQRLRQLHANGAILLTAFPEALLKEILKMDIRLVMVCNFLTELPVSKVNNDEKGGSLKAVQYLYDHGVRDVAVISDCHNNNCQEQRLRGAREAFLQFELEWRNDTVFAYPDRHESEVEYGYLSTVKMIKERSKLPEALFVLSDRMAYGAIKALKEIGVECPGDIKIIGYDNLESSEHCFPTLTTVAVDKERLGRISVRLLLEMFKDEMFEPTNIQIPAKLIVRDSA